MHFRHQGHDAETTLCSSMTMFVSANSPRRNPKLRVKKRFEDDESIAETVKSSAYSVDCAKSESAMYARTVGYPEDTQNHRKLFRRRPSCLSYQLGADERSEASSLTSPVLSADDNLRRMEQLGEIILENLRTAIVSHAKDETDLIVSIQVHVDRARARMAGKNTVGAILSMRRMKQVQAEYLKVHELLNFLRRREAQLISKINDARAMTALRCGDDGGFSSFSVSGKISYDLSSFEDCSERINEIKSWSYQKEDITDDELLYELATLEDSPERDGMGERIEI